MNTLIALLDIQPLEDNDTIASTKVKSCIDSNGMAPDLHDMRLCALLFSLDKYSHSSSAKSDRWWRSSPASEQLILPSQQLKMSNLFLLTTLSTSIIKEQFFNIIAVWSSLPATPLV